ncbi:Protein SMAX1-LIKE 3 [Linum grandiflorum]
MRTGICSIQQGLTPEAAGLVKQALTLARRRGHAQVTPLHVASTMLSSPGGLFQLACLQSHSHPLQSKALELCFNVSLNRLPTASSFLTSPPHRSSTYPSLSNALVAAFKRAQTHQRRGSLDNQQQPFLAVKIEADQLVISILDDPSVSRVMREAGFSSTYVKNRVEQAVNTTGGDNNSKPPQPIKSLSNFGHQHQHRQKQQQFRIPKLAPVDHYNVNFEDVKAVLNTMGGNNRRNIVVTGECIDTSEAVVRAVMDNVERGLVPMELRSARFVSLPLFSLCSLSKEEIDMKIMELRCNYLNNSSSSSSRGVILYVGDLNLAAEFWSNYGEQSRYMSSILYYRSMEYIIMEMKRLVRENSEAGKLWMLGIASFQTYIKCKAGHPSLETMWELFPLTVPVGSLSLSLNLNSELEAPRSKVSRSNYESNFQKSDSTTPTSTPVVVSNLPPWLQQCKEDTAAEANAATEEKVFTFFDIFKPNKRSPHQVQTPPDTSSSLSTSFRLVDDDTKPDLLSNPNSSPNSASSSEANDDREDDLESFKEFNGDNLKILCSALEQKVPQQKEIIPQIATAVLECRSGMNRRNLSNCNNVNREDTWLLFSGTDSQGKEKVARELARVVYGSSQTSFVTINKLPMASTSSGDYHHKGESSNDDDDDDDDDLGGDQYLKQLGLALNENPHRVFFFEDFHPTGWKRVEKGIKKAIRTGTARLPGGEFVPFKDAIVILSCNDSQSSSAPLAKKRKRGDQRLLLSLDLNMAIEDDLHDDYEHSIDQQRNPIVELVDRRIVFQCS